MAIIRHHGHLQRHHRVYNLLYLLVCLTAEQIQAPLSLQDLSVVLGFALLGGDRFFDQSLRD